MKMNNLKIAFFSALFFMIWQQGQQGWFSSSDCHAAELPLTIDISDGINTQQINLIGDVTPEGIYTTTGMLETDTWSLSWDIEGSLGAQHTGNTSSGVSIDIRQMNITNLTDQTQEYSLLTTLDVDPILSPIIFPQFFFSSSQLEGQSFQLLTDNQLFGSIWTQLDVTGIPTIPGTKFFSGPGINSSISIDAIFTLAPQDVSPGPGQFMTIGAFSIANDGFVVPEPSTLYLLITFVVSLFTFRVIRKKNS